MIRVGINGFGRIGRALTRLIFEKKIFKLCLVNEKVNDIKNLAYLLKHDSIYGKFEKDIKVKGKNLIIDNKTIYFSSHKKIDEAEWANYNVDIVIDASGTHENLILAKNVIKTGVKKVLVTNSPKSDIDFTMIIGVNDNQYNYRKHNLISSSICDASAITPLLKAISLKWGISSGFITTLHSRLSYQNLLDGTVESVSSPGHNWKDYSLGRDSMASLITKKTTAIEAISKCLPLLKNKILGLSYRVPTAIVCSADITLQLKKKPINKQTVLNFLKNLSKKFPSIFGYQTEALVSIDHLKTEKSLVIDSNFVDLSNTKLLKLIIWYDNEWGYSNKVLDIVKKILKK